MTKQELLDWIDKEQKDITLQVNDTKTQSTAHLMCLGELIALANIKRMIEQLH